MTETTSPAAPYHKRRIVMAKLLAASIMGLRKDATGANLPEDIWHQMLAKADAVFVILSEGDRAEASTNLESHHV